MRSSSNNHHHTGAVTETGALNLVSLNSLKRGQHRVGQSSARASATDSAGWAQTFWGRKLLRSMSMALALVCSASIALADVKVTTKNAAGGQSLTSTTYIKGSRQRTEGMGYTSIYQCDLKRIIYINDKARTYFIAPTGEADGSKGANHPGTGARASKGGVITYTTTNTDTGERREIHGLTARHLKTKTVVEASEDACTPMNMEMETDGWYVDLPGGLSCATDESGAPKFPVEQADCVDEVRYKTVGTVKSGYPVMTTVKIKFNAGVDGSPGNIPTSTSTQEVVDFSTATLAASLFEVPAGYTEVKSMQALGSPY
ncbi:MAG TPA: hypothetical protein VM095_13440 [Pyrinomonadaceae bacterium]|nr:hypothetical protein [Pyrinomonadaceae bacterium]